MDSSYAHNAPTPALHSVTSSESLSGRISDFTDYEWYDDGGQASTVYARPPLVSLRSNNNDSDYQGPQYGPGQSNSSYSYTDYSKNGYSPETDGQRIANKKSSRGFGSGRALKRTPPTILEEDDGIDMGLLNHAQPISRGGEVEQPAEDRDTARLAVDDIPLALRPGTWHNQGLVRKLQEREAQGRLTGGLGRGIKTDATILESDLLATSPVIELLPPTPLPRSISNSLSRTFTLGRRKSHVGRTEAVKRLGQSEADKSGKVIEVIIEEEAIGMDQSEIDLSHLTGPNTGIIRGPSQMRQSAFPMKEQRKEIFYPQPNWKPFSMRWPYLLSLILLSAGLGCASETIYQMSLKKPLMTFHTPSDIPSADYFAFKFLPTLISVTFGVLWQITDFEVKRLEAFYQLSREGGALAAESINVDYITNFSFLRPIHALYRRHYAVAVSSVATILANALVPTLGAASIVLWPDRV